MAAMRRSLSSCLDATRIWRNTERASLEKNPSMRLSQAVRGREGELEAAGGLLGKPGLGLLGDVCRMIVEDQLDRGMARIGGIDKLKEFDELAAAMAIPDQGVNLTGQQIDAGQQADRAVTFVFMIAGDGRVSTRLGRQVRRGRRNRLDTWLLVIGDDRHRVAGLFLGFCRGLLDELHLAVGSRTGAPV